MQTDLLILQDQNEVFSTGIKSEKGKGDNISKALDSDDLSEEKEADFLSTLIGITNDQEMSQVECLALLNSSKEEAIDAASIEFKVEISGLKSQGPELKAESLKLEAESSEFKAQNTDTDKAARISTMLKEAGSPQIPDQETKEAETRLPLQVTSRQGSKLEAVSSQPEAQRSTLNAQRLNSNLQEAGEVVKNLIKNQASNEAAPKTESNFQDINTIAKNMENFDKNLSHKEPDNPLLFSESQSSDKASDTGLHIKETQLSQKALQNEVLTQIVKKAAFNLKNGQTEVKIDLKPEFLGRIQLKISTENQQVMVRMLTEIPLVKDIVENNINHLKADLQNHGLEIDKFDVFLTRDPDQHENGHENTEFLKKNGETGEGEADDILAKEMEEEAWFAHERAGANLIGIFA